MESILDKLVSAPVSREAPPTEPATTRPVEAVETPEEVMEHDKERLAPPAKPDEHVLQKLTQTAEPVQPKPAVKTEPVLPKPAQQEQTKQSIIDQLTGRSQAQNADKKQTDERQGDSGDA